MTALADNKKGLMDDEIAAMARAEPADRLSRPLRNL